MSDMKAAITDRLERAFAERGFAEPGVAELRDRAGVSLRTLYKYFPSRDEMVVATLESRHQRYLDFLFSQGEESSLETVFDRVGEWMANNAPAGCLFHDAVAAHPTSVKLKALLASHKEEVARRLCDCAGSADLKSSLLLLHEGLIQSWPLEGKAAVKSAKDLAGHLLSRAQL